MNLEYKGKYKKYYSKYNDLLSIHGGSLNILDSLNNKVTLHKMKLILDESVRIYIDLNFKFNENKCYVSYDIQYRDKKNKLKKMSLKHEFNLEYEKKEKNIKVTVIPEPESNGYRFYKEFDLLKTFNLTLLKLEYLIKMEKYTYILKEQEFPNNPETMDIQDLTSKIIGIINNDNVIENINESIENISSKITSQIQDLKNDDLPISKENVLNTETLRKIIIVKSIIQEKGWLKEALNALKEEEKKTNTNYSGMSFNPFLILDLLKR